MPPSWSLWILLVHAGAACAMAGLIWFVQVVHYPLFASVDAQVFPAYHLAHTRLTTLVVGPLMLIEAATALWIVGGRSATPPQAWIGLALLAAVWGATMWISVPRHTALAEGFNATAHAGLVATNWIRTVGWSLRAALSLAMVAGALRAH